MNIRLRKALVAVAALTALVPAASGALTGAATATAAAPRSSANLELKQVFNTPGGTDLEFFSRTLATYKDASNKNVTPEVPVERHFAMVGNQTTGAKIYDITNPEGVYLVAAMKCTVGQGDIQVTRDGMVAAIADASSGVCNKGPFGKGGAAIGQGSVLVDLSDVYTPTVVGGAAESQGSHNQTIHPSGKYLYISTSALSPSDGANSRVPIYDISNPAAPVKVKDFMIPANGPHDIRFSQDGTRAYMAGISAYNIVDTTDPRNPVLISSIVPPGGSIGHDTLITKDKRFLFLGDEAGGGAAYPCPGGAVYAYDLADEKRPLLIGVAEAGGGPVTNRIVDEAGPGAAPTAGCTSHVMDLNPDGKSFTIGWYSLGFRVFDFSSFYNADGTPKTAGAIGASWGKYGAGLVETAYFVPDNARTWSAKQYSKVPGYIFADDVNVGFYITKIKP